MNAVAQKGPGRPRKSWDEVLENGRKKLGMDSADPHNRYEWRVLHICCLSFIYCLLISDDLIIDSQQVVYISFNIFLERMTNHFKIPNVVL